MRCEDLTSLLPVNLPTDVDVHVEIAYDQQTTPVDLLRNQSCKIKPGSSADAPFDKTTSPIGLKSFVEVFNDYVFDEFGKLLPTDPAYAHRAFVLMQRFLAGRRLFWNTELVRDPYREPYFELNLKAPHETSLYWFLGLMVRLGTKKDLSALQSIQRVDIEFRKDGKALPGSISIPPIGLMTNLTAGSYFSEIGVGFTRNLSGDLSPHEKIVYVGPGTHGFQPPKAGTGDVWRLEQDPAHPTATQPEQKVPQADRPVSLGRLGAIQIRSQTKKKEGTDNGVEDEIALPAGITFDPGIAIEGHVRPYRRFSGALAAGAANTYLPTVMHFEPEKRAAALLEELRTGLPAQFAEAFAKLQIDGWKFQLLHAGLLPWDGPQPLYRVLATKEGTAPSGKPRTLQTQAASLFFAATTGLPAALQNNGARSPQMWRPEGLPSTGKLDASALSDYWHKKCGDVWPSLPINAIRTATAPLEKVALQILCIDEFSFEMAESVVRLEKSLSLAVDDLEGASCVPDGTTPEYHPAKDYKADLQNFNTAFVRRVADGKPLGEEIHRGPQRVQADSPSSKTKEFRNRQDIPLAHSWPKEPLNVPAADGVSAPPSNPNLDNDDVRKFIALQYGVQIDQEAGPYEIDLEHTYGERLAASDANGAIHFSRSARLDWPVELPSFADFRGDPDKPPAPFLSIHYDADARKPAKGVSGAPANSVTLLFDLTRLNVPPSILPAGQAKVDDPAAASYAVALSAWRSLAELASDGSTAEIHFMLATYALDNVIDFNDPQADLNLAQRGIGDWVYGIAQKPHSVPVSDAALAAVKAWAKSMMTTTAASSFSGTQSFAIPLMGARLGDLAHLVQARFLVTRAARQSPFVGDGRQMKPNSQQPGLFSVADKTFAAVWSTFGFGTTSSLPGDAGPLVAALNRALDRWTKQRTAFCDSIMPYERVSDSLATHAPAAISGETVSALTSALVGTDWFAPAGPGPVENAYAVQPVIVPIGFAPCAPHPQLGILTQLMLQRLVSTLRDIFDFSVLCADDWPTHMAKVAQFSESSRFADLIKALVDRLVYPELAPDDALDSAVRYIVDAYRPPNGGGFGIGDDFKAVRARVAKKLFDDIGLYDDAKGFLLTAMRFSQLQSNPAAKPTAKFPSPKTAKTARPTALARSRFFREIEAQKDSVQPQFAVQSVGAIANISDLVLVPAAPDDGTASIPVGYRKLGFLETLDDTKYTHRFSVASDATQSYAAESFEEMVDSNNDSPAWYPLPIRVPSAKANGGTAAKRPVDLASRSLVAAPALLWSGVSASFSEALAATDADSRYWTLTLLKKGEAPPPKTGAAPADVLSVVAHKPVALDLGAEQDVVFALYQITGDEEGTTGLREALQRDAFYLLLEREAPWSGGDSKGVALSPTLPVTIVDSLRTLLQFSRGSPDVVQAARKVAFDLPDKDYRTLLDEVIKSGTAQLPDKDNLRIALSESTSFDIRSTPGSSAGEQALKRMGDAVLFANESTQGANPVGYLLLSFIGDVWNPVEWELSQGRNLPLAPWIDPSQTKDDVPPPFAPEYWQAAAQMTPKTRQPLAKVYVNSPNHWHEPRHRLRLSKRDWQDRVRSPEDLLDALVFNNELTVGDALRHATIFATLSKVKLFTLDLSITVFQEQFAVDPAEVPDAEPMKERYPLRNTYIAVGDGHEMRIWFPADYTTFSIDLQWFAKSGLSAMRIERLFVEIVDS